MSENTERCVCCAGPGPCITVDRNQGKTPSPLTREFNDDAVEKWIEHIGVVVPKRFHANEDGSMGPQTITCLDALSWKEWEFLRWALLDYATLRARVAELERAETERIEWVKRAEQAEEVNDELREQLAALTLTWTTARPTDGGA